VVAMVVPPRWGKSARGHGVGAPGKEGEEGSKAGMT
jgi:hypothetical protein